MKIYFPIAKVDGERREVWGYASTEARDDQGEVVTREALTAALGDYMKFANIREMHQLSAVGVAKEAAVDDKGLYLGAKIVDDQAWQKIIEGVYKGYSIGGRVTNRDPADHNIITGLVLNEISLVDRPANPEAVFDYWKAGGISNMPEGRFHAPFQIWACGVPGHRHLAKSDAVKCQETLAFSGIDSITAAKGGFSNAADMLEKSEAKGGPDAPYGNVPYADPGYQPDGKNRYPIDTERHIRAAWEFINRPSNARRYTLQQLDEIKSRIISAWKAKINEAGPPMSGEASKIVCSSIEFSLTKALWDVGHVARIIVDLKWLQENLAIEAMMEGDDSLQPSRLLAIIADLCTFLNDLVAEETDEILDNTQVDGAPGEPRAAEIVVMAAGATGGTLLAELCRDRGPRMRKFAAALLAKVKHSDGDQAVLDLAYHAVDKCMGMDGLLFAEKSHMAAARDALKAAGAMVGEEATADPLGGLVRGPLAGCRESNAPDRRATIAASAHPSSGADPGVLRLLTAALGKNAPGHQALMDIAHDCIGKLTDGMCCTSSKAGARHSQDTMSHLTAAHDHIVLAGAKCDAADRLPGTENHARELEPIKTATGDLARLLAEERAQKASLVATLTDILPRLDRLTKRVEDIEQTPLPPLAVAKTVSSISKHQDAGTGGFSADELAEAFAQMSKEEQTLTLIKASYAHPIHPPGFTATKKVRSE
jgi:phage head maturation protease